MTQTTEYRKARKHMTRREAREAVFSLLFETEFRADEDTADIFAVSCEERECPGMPCTLPDSGPQLCSGECIGGRGGGQP